MDIDDVLKSMPYRFGSGYPSVKYVFSKMSDLTADANKIYSSLSTRLEIDRLDAQSYARLLCGLISNYWFYSDSPVYLISKDMFDLFQNTEFDLTYEVADRVLEALSGIVILLVYPEKKENKFISPERKDPLFSLIALRCAIANKDLSEKIDIPLSFVSLYKDETFRLNLINRGGVRIDQEVSVVAQILLYLATQDNPTIAAEEYAPRIYTHKNKSKKKFWYPRVIHAEPKKIYPKRESLVKGTSPRSHWRMGHWRNTPVGEGRSQRKLNWIKPVLVNPEV